MIYGRVKSVRVGPIAYTGQPSICVNIQSDIVSDSFHYVKWSL